MHLIARARRAFGASDGRIKVGTLIAASVTVVTAFLIGVLPALAGSGDPSGLGVQPVEVTYGGGPGACAANFPGRLPSAATYELHIQNPRTDTYTLQDGTNVDIVVDANDEYFSFTIDPTSNWAAFDVVVNGGSQNTHYDYDGNGGPGPVQSDTLLHAPTKGGSSNLFKLSHINLCYDLFVPNVTGYKYHDRDADGTFDPTEEEGLAGWTIAAFNASGTRVAATMTGADGSYTLGNLGTGTFTICEATNTDGLPDAGEGFTWAWTQSDPTSSDGDYGDCSGVTGSYEDDGYQVTLSADDDLFTKDFGNHIQVGIECANEVVLSLGGTGIDDNPYAEVTVPAGTPSCSNGNVWTATFDVGRSAPDDQGGEGGYEQLVVFSGPATVDPRTMTMTVEWDAEEAVYETVNGELQLVVPTTQISLAVPATTLVDIELCGEGEPSVGGQEACLESRTIAEGGGLFIENDLGELVPAIQITDVIKFLGDPGVFR